MKKILIMMMVLSFVFPVSNTFAVKNETGERKKYILEFEDEIFIAAIRMMPKIPMGISVGFFNLDHERVSQYGLGAGEKNDVPNKFVKYIIFELSPGQELINVHIFKDSSTAFENYTKIVEYTDGYFPEKIIYDSITDLRSEYNYSSVTLNWLNPINENHVSTLIKQNGIEIAEISSKLNVYEIRGLTSETSYVYDVIARYSDDELSVPISIAVMTDAEPAPPEPVGDVENLIAKVEHHRVDLSWNLPESENFKHVNIYRDTLEKSLLDKIFGVKSVKAATKIFETNGTYFNDLTVQAETKYEYLLTTESTEGLESAGISTTVITLKEPEPEIGGGGYEKDPESGDFTYSWDTPTTGSVKVMIGKDLYATVPAIDGKITIPSEKMKYTMFGKPDVGLIPVNEKGDEGKPVKPPAGGEGSDGIGELPFTVPTILKTTFDLLKLFGPLILLYLIIYLVPRLIKIIKKSMEKSKGGESGAK